MMHFTNALYLIAILKLLRTDASVTIHPVGVEIGNGYFECGEKLTLTCEITGNPVSITWQNDSSNFPFANCFAGTCSVHPAVENKYELTQDTSKGLFNLTFDLTSYNNGTTYKCDDSLTSDSTLVLMRDFKPTLNEFSLTNIVSVNTGCISPSVKVEFSWRKIDNKSEESDLNLSNLYVTNDTTSCDIDVDVDCGGPDMIKQSMSIEVMEEEGSAEYHLQVIVKYGDDDNDDDDVQIESPVSTHTYKIKDTMPTTKHQTQSISTMTNFPSTVNVSDMTSSVYIHTSSHTTTSSSSQNPNILVLVIVVVLYFLLMGLCFAIHIGAAIVFSVFILCKNYKETCFDKISGYITTALAAIPSHVLLVMICIKMKECGCGSCCLHESCNILCILGYCWFVVVVFHYPFGAWLISKIRKRFKDDNKIDTNASVLKDSLMLTISFYFVYLTYFILIAHWIYFKLVNKKNSKHVKNDSTALPPERTAFPSERASLPSIPPRKSGGNIQRNLQQEQTKIKKNTALASLSPRNEKDVNQIETIETDEIKSKIRNTCQTSNEHENTSANRTNSSVDDERQVEKRQVSNEQTQKKSKKKSKRAKPGRDNEMSNGKTESFSIAEGYSITHENEQDNRGKHVTVISTVDHSEGKPKPVKKGGRPLPGVKNDSEHHTGTPDNIDKSFVRRGLSTCFDDPNFDENLSVD